jgi:tetratricopeptide (TPR) repeat protein
MVSALRAQDQSQESQTIMSLVAHKYTPGEMSDHELEATFAARGHTVDYLVKSLRDQMRSGTLSSFVITAPRGGGKSTVIQMVDLRIRQDAELSAAWIPVVFPEEQFNIASLRDLLAATLEVLTKGNVPEAAEWLKKVADEPNDEQSQQLAITGLKAITRKAGKRLVLFVENLNLLLEESLNDQMKGTLRRLLMTDPFMMLMGSSVHLFDSLKQYHEAFFNYFGQVPLDRLTPEQVFELLKRRAQFDNNERFLKEFPKQQPKIRAIVHLSGGNPRLILMLYELLSQQQVTTIVQYLRRLVDELTPLLKDEMENLPPQQRKIMHALMEKGGTAQPADLVAPTRLPLNAITVQLRRLKDSQIVEVLGGGKGRAANYTVPDKLFAIWYQMRYLSQNRRRIELFVEVLRVWFEEEERVATLKSLAQRMQSNTPEVLRECATTTEYFAASLKGTVHEQVAAELCIQHWIKTDFREAAFACADLMNSEVECRAFDEAHAHAKLGEWLTEHGEYPDAIKALDETIADQSLDANTLAEALRTRSVAKSRIGDGTGAIRDLTAIVENPSMPTVEVGVALVLRGLCHEAQHQPKSALEDFTNVIELDGAPPDIVAMALVSRGCAKGNEDEQSQAIADFSAVLKLVGASPKNVAMALINRGISKGHLGDLDNEIADYSAVLKLKDAPKEGIARAFLNRGVAKDQIGDLIGAISDYSAIVDLDGAPIEQLTAALVNRAEARGRQGDIAALIADCSAVLKLSGAPKEQVCKALINRGIAHGQSGNLGEAIQDLTSVVEVNGASNELIATALINRGLAKGKQGDNSGSSADFSQVVEMKDVSVGAVARALFLRALGLFKARKTTEAIADMLRVVESGATETLVEAADLAFSLLWAHGDRAQAAGVLAKLSTVITSLPKGSAREITIRFLSSLASPPMKKAWPFAWQILSDSQLSEVKEAAEFLRPVSAVLEDQDVALLEALPPEQREFAKSVLARFEEKEERDEPKRKLETRASKSRRKKTAKK